MIFFVKQKTAYELRISDWSSDVCSSDLLPGSLLSSNLVNIGRDRAPVALCDVEHLCLERCDLIIEADAIVTLIIGDGQRVIAVPGLLHLVIPLQHRLNALASGLSATTMLVEVLDGQMQGDGDRRRLFRQPDS